MFRFPTLELKAPDQPQSAGEESLLTNDITWLLVQHLVKVFIKIESKEEIVLSCNSKNYLSNVS